MSQVAENVIPGLEVIEHFGEAQEVLARFARLDSAVRLLADCDASLALPFGGDFGLRARLQSHASALRLVLASPDQCGLGSAVRSAILSYSRFGYALAVWRSAVGV